MKDVIKIAVGFFTHRLFIILLIVLALFYVLVMRLFDLQIIQGEDLERKFELSVRKDIELKGQRGNIYDRNGFPLAENVIAYDVYLNDSYRSGDDNKMVFDIIRIIQKNQDEVLLKLPIIYDEFGQLSFGTMSEREIDLFKKEVLGLGSLATLTDEQAQMTARDLFEYLRDIRFRIDTETYSEKEILGIIGIRHNQWVKRYSKYQPDLIAMNVKLETLAELEENRDQFPGISIVENPIRVYNDATYFAHIIGYIGKIDSETLKVWEPLGYNSEDIVGKTGIEKSMESALHGTHGKQSVEVNSLGKTMAVLSTVKPEPGQDVYLTIDKELQIETYHLLEKHLAGVLAERLRLTETSDGNKQFTLVKDVFTSLVKTDRLRAVVQEDADMTDIEIALYNRYIDRYSQVMTNLDSHFNATEVSKFKDNLDTYTKYILNRLKDDGRLERYFRSNENYSVYLKGELTFTELINIYIEADGFDFGTRTFESPEEEFEYVMTYISERYLGSYDFKKQIYLELIENDKLSLAHLSILLILQELVIGDETQIQQLLNGRLKPLDFMREKILNVELTPHEIALDPSAGSVVISDVKTGEVLALVSYPSYDNNQLVQDFLAKDYEYYLSLLKDPNNPLYPRATQSRTAPGSTFKMVIATAALEEEVIGISERYACQGLYQKIFPPAKCWIYDLGGSHGPLDIKTAIEVSCNYFFYDMGYRLATESSGLRNDTYGIHKIDEYAARFGLDSKTGIELPESDSTMSTQDSSRTAIGQGAMSFTPIQLVRYMNTLANGGELKTLSLVDKVKTKTGELTEERSSEILREATFKEANIAIVKEGMLAVTQGPKGSVRSTFANFPIDVAGKTGTAQENLSRPPHSLFASFAPYDNPEISVVAVMQFSHTSLYAAQLAKDVIGNYYDLEKVVDPYSQSYILD